MRLLSPFTVLVLSTASTNAQGWAGGGGGYGKGFPSGSNGCPPWLAKEQCSGQDGSSNNLSNFNDLSSLGLSADQILRTSRLITIHAVLACVVWILIIPTGGMLIRSGIRSRWVVRAHAILQSFGLLAYVIAVGLGIWLVKQLSFGQFSLWSSVHTRFGIAILLSATFQPVLGAVHHRAYKRMITSLDSGKLVGKARKTTPGTIHLWLGRLLIVAGVTNGALGLRLAAESPFRSNTRAKSLAYGTGTGIMFLIYTVFIIMSGRRRMKDVYTSATLEDEGNGKLEDVRTTTTIESSTCDQRPPPSYEQSQAVVDHGAPTTAR